MPDSPSVVVHFKDLEIEEPVLEQVRVSIEKRCEALAQEFAEIQRFELTIEADGAGVSVHGHATGKNTDVAGHALAPEPGPASDQALAKIERALRKHHDKRIYAQRREAQKVPPKRRNTP
jgi:ribosome-associated translation inhibitor RaiA